VSGLDSMGMVSAAGFEPSTHALKEPCWLQLPLCSQQDSLISLHAVWGEMAVFGS